MTDTNRPAYVYDPTGAWPTLPPDWYDAQLATMRQHHWQTRLRADATAFEHFLTLNAIPFTFYHYPDSAGVVYQYYPLPPPTIPTTIPTTFNPDDLPGWAQDYPAVIALCQTDLAYRADVARAETDQYRLHLVRVADRRQTDRENS